MDRFSKEDRDLLIRLDARLQSIEKTVTENHIVMSDHINDLKKDFASNVKEASDKFVTKIEFTPVQKAVYAVIGFILTGFLGAVLSLVLKTATILPH